MSLETTAEKLANFLFSHLQMEEMERAKIQYGLSLFLGVVIEFSIALIISSLIGTIALTAIIMLAALSLRIFTGGAHCSSFNRCTMFTLVYFTITSVPVKQISLSWGPGEILFLALFLVLFSTVTVLRIGYAFPTKTFKGFVGLWAVLAVVVLIIDRSMFTQGLLVFATGLFLQSFILTKLGNRFVAVVDSLLKNLRL